MSAVNVNITQAEVTLLGLIERQALAGSEIAAQMSVAYPNVHGMLTRMIKRGLVTEQFVDDENRSGLRKGEKRRKFKATAAGSLGIKFFKAVFVEGGPTRFAITENEMQLMRALGRKKLSGAEITAGTELRYPNVFNMLTRMVNLELLSDEYVEDANRKGLRKGEKRRKFRLMPSGTLGMRFFDACQASIKALEEAPERPRPRAKAKLRKSRSRAPGRVSSRAAASAGTEAVGSAG